MYEALKDVQPDLTDLRDFSNVRDNVININKYKGYDFNGFNPTPVQLGTFQEIMRRDWVSRAMLIWPRRTGKTIFGIISLILMSLKKAAETEFPYLRYGIVFPDLVQAKDVAWEELIKYTTGLPNLKILKNTGVVECMVRNRLNRPCKIMYRLVGLKNLEGRRGGFYDGLCMDERKDIPSTFKPVINPMLSDKQRQPTFLWQFGTPDDSDDFWGDYELWRSQELQGNLKRLTMWTNYSIIKHLTEEGYQEATEGMSQAEIDIEYGCKKGVRTGASYFATDMTESERMGRVRDIDINEEEDKIVFQDIGASKQDMYAMGVVQVNRVTGAFEVIDYVEIPQATEEKVVNWINTNRYVVKQMILPWDANVGMSPPVVNLQKLMPNTEMTVLQRVQSKMDRISAMRRLFAKFHFNRFKTIRLQNCLKRYSKDWDKKEKIYKITPKHDQYSHGADAICYFAQAVGLGLVDMSKGKGQLWNISSPKVIKPYEPLQEWEGDDKLEQGHKLNRMWLGG